MRFTCEINMDNDAFADYLEIEMTRILQQVADNQVCYALSKQGYVRDSNGNTVGKWEIEP